MGPFRTIWFKFCRWVVKTAVFTFSGGLKLIGHENIPATGAVIIAPIHVSHLDPPAAACGAKRVMPPMAKEELFKVPVMGPICRSLGGIPVKRGETDPEAIKECLAVLEGGNVLMVFPEGTRGDGVTMLPINRGVTMLAKRTKAKVVPVGIVGTFDRLPRGSSKMKRGPVTVIYGEPFTYEEIATSTSEKQNREIFANELGRRIAKLCNDYGYPIKIAEKSSAPQEVNSPA